MGAARDRNYGSRRRRRICIRERVRGAATVVEEVSVNNEQQPTVVEEVSVNNEQQPTVEGPTNTELLDAIGRSETLGMGTPYTTLHEERNGERAVGKYGIKPSTAIQPGYGVPTVYQLAKDMDITVP